MLGKWAVIDIETTGIDPSYDQVIDVGFLQFEGTRLVKKYNSLVHCAEPLSYFIQNLTGITTKMLKRAPSWDAVESDLQELYGHHLIAHNAKFERSFLEYSFDRIDDDSERESYEDSLNFLALLNPQSEKLNLEKFIVELQLGDSEVHRGFEDSVDLLKVLLVSISLIHQDLHLKEMMTELFKKYGLDNYWYYHLFSLESAQLQEIASQIEFDLESHLEKIAQIRQTKKAKEVVEEFADGPYFSLECSSKNLQEIYASVEDIKSRITNFSYRKSQEELSLKTGQAFKNRVHVLVQAPTGTGKTLGYLLPAALFTKSEDKQVLIATGTKTLQHQAITKDVPQLRKLLGISSDDLKIRRLVGSSNHLCELLFRQSIKEEDLLFSARDFETRFTDMYFELVFYHNSQSAVEDLKGRDDLPFVLKRSMSVFKERESEIVVDFRSCTGKRCPFKLDCTYIRGLREAKDADIIIGNHALMFSWPKSFPRPEYIVVDEAHKIEDEATSSFSVEVTQYALGHLSKSLKHLQGIGSLFYLLAQFEDQVGDSTELIKTIREETLKTQSMLEDHLQVLPDLIEQYFKKRPRYTDTFWNELPMIGKESPGDATSVAIFNHLESVQFIITNYNNYLLPHASRFDVKNLDDENHIVALTRFETFRGQLDDLQLGLECIMEKRESYSHSLKYHESFGFALLCAPIDVGRVLHDGLLQTSGSVLFTSATLGNAHGDQGARGIEWSTGYAYLAAERRFKTGFYLDSNFDYKNNTRVYLCDDTPPFYDSSFVESVLAPTVKLIRDLQGRTLLLFSARKRFEVAREVLIKEFEGELPLFIQGMGNNIVEDFKNSGRGILLGMESFGEGIDVPGEALQFVFIDKIPDLRMDQVINDRRDFYESNLGNEFTDYYLAHRTRSLQQKMGRLLRSERDIGGVIIVDSRIKRWKGRTMEKVVKLLEPYNIRRTTLDEACSGVRDFLL